MWIPLKVGIGGEREGDFTDNFSMSIGPLASCDKCFHHQVDHKNGSSSQNRLNPCDHDVVSLEVLTCTQALNFGLEFSMKATCGNFILRNS